MHGEQLYELQAPLPVGNSPPGPEIHCPSTWLGSQPDHHRLEEGGEAQAVMKWLCLSLNSSGGPPPPFGAV